MALTNCKTARGFFIQRISFMKGLVAMNVGAFFVTPAKTHRDK
jgi:hypothetical protein